MRKRPRGTITDAINAGNGISRTKNNRRYLTRFKKKIKEETNCKNRMKIEQGYCQRTKKKIVVTGEEIICELEDERK